MNYEKMSFQELSNLYSIETDIKRKKEIHIAITKLDAVYAKALRKRNR